MCEGKGKEKRLAPLFPSPHLRLKKSEHDWCSSMQKLRKTKLTAHYRYQNERFEGGMFYRNVLLLHRMENTHLSKSLVIVVVVAWLCGKGMVWVWLMMLGL
ncbi:hypothetical protein BC832DRAFT_241613 [Gaertneriomyces semiglobifer]|nr:hypothetical protein BC832DRAFT_241613 [Gaertneriomyces semiglobifer]